MLRVRLKIIAPKLFALIHTVKNNGHSNYVRKSESLRNKKPSCFQILSVLIKLRKTLLSVLSAKVGP